jgi:hypothetical protein
MTNGSRLIGYSAAIAALVLGVDAACADESGISFWLPGQFGSLAALPQTPGWSLGAVYYHTSVEGSGSVAAAKEIQIGRFPATVNVNLNLNVKAQGDLMFLSPTYTFATPVLGGQFAVGLSGVFGRTSTNIDGTLTTAAGPFTTTHMGSIGDDLTSVGDLYPMMSLKWHDGVNNYVTYLTGDIPVGDYNPNSLANLGIGHGAIDGGGGYTYFNPVSGYEFSGVAGFTYNFKNPDTQYQSGVDFHFDWGASKYLSKQVFIGLVGYAYQQITNDSGQNLEGSVRSLARRRGGRDREHDLIEAGLNEAAGCFGAMGEVATACWRDCSGDGCAIDVKCRFGEEDLADWVLNANNRSGSVVGQLRGRYCGSRSA